MEVNVVTLEDGKEHVIIYALENELGKYIFLAEEDNPKNLNIRKVIEKEGTEYLTKLDSEDELDQVMMSFRNSQVAKEVNNEG